MADAKHTKADDAAQQSTEPLNEAGGNDAATQAIDLDYSDGVPAAKADVTHKHIVADPQADVLAWDPDPVATGDPTVPRADSHDPRPAGTVAAPVVEEQPEPKK
jgi:hypothetical protein